MCRRQAVPCGVYCRVMVAPLIRGAFDDEQALIEAMLLELCLTAGLSSQLWWQSEFAMVGTSLRNRAFTKWGWCSWRSDSRLMAPRLVNGFGSHTNSATLMTGLAYFVRVYYDCLPTIYQSWHPWKPIKLIFESYLIKQINLNEIICINFPMPAFTILERSI